MSELPFPGSLTTLLVDDEEVAISRLKKLLQVHPEIHITGAATDGRQAITFINRHKPALVFLDIQLPGINGFDLLSALEYMPLVVFVTAYDAYAIKAFEINSLDYLLKPVVPERLAVTIKRIIAHYADNVDVLSKIKTLLTNQPSSETISTIPVKTGNKTMLVQVGDIHFLEAREKYCYIHTKSESYLTDFTLTYLQERLPAGFLRIHRSFIINKLKIQEIHKYLKGTYLLIMADVHQTRIKSAYSYSEIIKQQLLLF
ncbi:LytTR family transcriptional regulator DNA-binding domain-containing protein [Chitinophaga pendula]|uniref:LytR/AlgR family response regulator transcription factor n=1 Tax=Chitinophaga TaxID=79328 RepID=UPI000BAFF9B8|nr:MULTISPECIES: LytTR family transcriptional regulator DNA-binding domain-containing protein [Chitinophaga]ASZ11869.1 DNA-binding response regulator [Chitinophaga sp. MD30]UCJ05106.1 LytTR family transcriptional regulator DNA-binding domain-containing protein [Chitinophaga pendula]